MAGAEEDFGGNLPLGPKTVNQDGELGQALLRDFLAEPERGRRPMLRAAVDRGGSSARSSRPRGSADDQLDGPLEAAMDFAVLALGLGEQGIVAIEPCDDPQQIGVRGPNASRRYRLAENSRIATTV